MLCWVFEGLEKWDNTDTEVMLVCIVGTSVSVTLRYCLIHSKTHLNARHGGNFQHAVLPI